MAKTRSPVDEYLASQPAAARAVLQRVRDTVRKALPAASEEISYQIPTYKIDGRMVLYFSGAKQHWAIHPATDHLLKTLGAELAGRLHGRGTLRFSYDEVPVRLITRIAKVRAEEAAAATTAAKKKKTAAKRAVPQKKAAAKKAAPKKKTAAKKAAPKKAR